MADDTKGVSLDEFIFRKLQPVRILRGYLAGELELAEADAISMSRMDIDNIVTTLDIFLEEYDRVSGYRGRKGNDRKKTSFMDAKAQAIKTIA